MHSTTQPAAITDGKTYIELEHAIGLNIECWNPVHYVHRKCNNNNEQNENQNSSNILTIEEEKESDKKNESSELDYLLVCGSSIVLSSFTNPHCQTFLRGHTSSITCCVVSANKKYIATSQNGSRPDVYIWDTNTNKLIYKLEEHNKCVQRMSFSDDSRFLATVGSSADGKMYIWDMNSGYIVTCSVIKPSPVLDISWGGRVKDIKKRPTTDYLFATCGIEQVRIWALTPSSGKLLSEKCNTSKCGLHSRRTFTCLAFSDTADLLIAATSSGDFFIFDVRKLCVLTNYQANCVGGINCILTCKLQGEYIHDPLSKQYFIKIIVGCGDGSISIWQYNDDLEKFIEEKKIIIHEKNGAIKCMDIDDENKNKLLIATKEGNIHQINIDKNHGQNKAISYNETSSIIGVKFPRDINTNDSFVTVSERGSIRRWSINDYSILLSHDNNCNNCNNNKICCFDFNQEIIITGWSDGCIRTYNSNKSNDGILWNIKDAQLNGVSCLRLGYNEKYIISAGFDGTLRVWDIRFKKLVTHLKEHKGSINAIELYSDSRHALTASKDRSFICWDFATQKRISCHRQNMGSINDIRLNKNEDIVITCGGDRCITFWDIRQSKPINYIKNAHSADISCMQISSNSLIATADTQSVIKLWDLKTLNLISKQNAYCGKINGIAFSNDNKQIVSVANDSSIMLWNIFSM